jgi:hypothetical protein
VTAVLRVLVLAVAVPSASMIGLLALCCLPPFWAAYPFVLYFGLPLGSVVYLSRVRVYLPTNRERVWFLVLAIFTTLSTWLVLAVLSIPY